MFARTILRSSAPLLGTAVIGTAVIGGAAAAYASQRPDQQASTPQPSTQFSKTTPSPKSQSSVDATKTFTGGIFFLSLPLHSATPINHNTKRLRFALPSPTATSGLSPVSALLTKAHIDGAWLPTLRPYTPISDTDTPGFIDLLVKRYDNGKMSNHLHSLQPGQTLSFMTGPLSGYPWTTNQHRHVALVAGGAGITPMYQLTKAILRNPEEKTRVSLVFGVNTEQDLLFKEEFAGLEREFGERFSCVYSVSHPREGKGEGLPEGYVTRALLEKTFPGPGVEGVKVLVCGPPGMEKAMVGGRWFGGSGGVLGEMGYKREQVVKL